jgi:hypothetical protein
MAAAGEVVELVGMEAKGAVGCKVEGDDPGRSASKEKSCSEGKMSLSGSGVPGGHLVVIRGGFLPDSLLRPAREWSRARPWANLPGYQSATPRG